MALLDTERNRPSTGKDVTGSQTSVFERLGARTQGCPVFPFPGLVLPQLASRMWGTEYNKALACSRFTCWKTCPIPGRRDGRQLQGDKPCYGHRHTPGAGRARPRGACASSRGVPVPSQQPTVLLLYHLLSRLLKEIHARPTSHFKNWSIHFSKRFFTLQRCLR